MLGMDRVGNRDRLVAEAAGQQTGLSKRRYGATWVLRQWEEP
jgi:hypothetical protein